MNAHSGITAALDADTRAMLDRVAAERGMSPEAYAAEAIRRAAESDTDFRAFVQAGIDSADRGELTPHGEVFASLRQRRQSRGIA
ncbi:CopG family transcriptional regulator [Sphingomonas immobilis]|uniref:CopG family transcriptional regulator n=1 Tax=Sphingomonas immobilis TaxID=3063997 RepID=A0ABT8ZWN9_9SPHN|nr:CopG family transcriptional regulator [Sphingomonas sp. CA1-15]MDO7841683.1 CopG family transcriptional regulator [Sphingomonas sp. CA1-15]